MTRKEAEGSPSLGATFPSPRAEEQKPTAPRLGRVVAVKELLHAGGEAERCFEREALITARLQHPSIINVQGAGVCDQRRPGDPGALGEEGSPR